MKILFFINGLSCGGKERRLVELLKALKLQPGIEYELVLMSKEICYKQVLELGITIHYIIRKTKKDLSGFNQFRNICQRFRPDIVHCWDSMTSIYSSPVCRIMGIKLVNGMVVDSPVVRNITNKSYLRAKISFLFSDVIVGNSQAGLKAYSAPARKSTHIYNGLDLGRFENLPDASTTRKHLFGSSEPDNLFVVGMVAAFEPRKDFESFINAAIILSKRYSFTRFIMIGDGSNLEDCRRLVPSELSEKIFFLGKRNDVETVVKTFDVGVLLTNAKVHGEGISNSLIEYMASGKAVIATKGGGTNETIIENENGYLLDPHSPEQLIDRISNLIVNPELVKKLGERSKEIVNQNFNLTVMARKYIELYRGLLKK
jgi:glycosyltransferase involved in cell wall biosynthesis